MSEVVGQLLESREKLDMAKKDAVFATTNAMNMVGQLAESQDEVRRLKRKIGSLQTGCLVPKKMRDELEEAKKSALVSEKKADDLEQENLDLQADVGRLEGELKKYRDFRKLVSRNALAVSDFLDKNPDPLQASFVELAETGSAQKRPKQRKSGHKLRKSSGDDDKMGKWP